MRVRCGTLPCLLWMRNGMVGEYNSRHDSCSFIFFLRRSTLRLWAFCAFCSHTNQSDISALKTLFSHLSACVSHILTHAAESMSVISNLHFNQRNVLLSLALSFLLILYYYSQNGVNEETKSSTKQNCKLKFPADAMSTYSSVQKSENASNPKTRPKWKTHGWQTEDIYI